MAPERLISTRSARTSASVTPAAISAARAQCERRPAVHREERDALAAFALRNDANQLDVAPVGARHRAE